MKTHEHIIDWGGSLKHNQKRSTLISNRGGQLQQEQSYVCPNLWTTAYDGKEAQSRTLAGGSLVLQGGWENVEAYFLGKARELSNQALELLAADNCPQQQCDLLLMPDQMMLQIHESIGHPLELDRILGDERNYAGTSFVTADMFGHYQYGSSLLNVSFDPNRHRELASCHFDDEGSPAQKQIIIQEGLLKQGLGGAVSQARSGLAGVANALAQNWNRPPLDRIGNLNIEPGNTALTEMIAGIENGILMETNRSWSIDDSRNKFQFGCERGQLIKNGELTAVVKNPNYRGISSQFWRNLIGVGNSLETYGTPYCGKAEPNQIIPVGHASPPCLFSNVEVFGGS